MPLEPRACAGVCRQAESSGNRRRRATARSARDDFGYGQGRYFQSRRELCVPGWKLVAFGVCHETLTAVRVFHAADVGEVVARDLRRPASDRRAICVVRRSSSEVRTKTLTVVRVLSQQGPSQHRDRRTGCDSRWCRQALLSGPELPSYRKLRPETSVSVPSMPSCQVLRYEASRRGGWRRARSASGPRKHRHRRETTPGSVFAD